MTTATIEHVEALREIAECGCANWTHPQWCGDGISPNHGEFFCAPCKARVALNMKPASALRAGHDVCLTRGRWTRLDESLPFGESRVELIWSNGFFDRVSERKLYEVKPI